MIGAATSRSGLRALTKTTILLSVVFLFALSSQTAAQKRFSRNYPAGQNVRLQLLNRTGTITVIGWNRAEVNITATMDAPVANIEPQNLSGTIVINLLRDNPGREVGDVNFTIRVPYYSMVDIETKIGNLSVTNISSGLVRAHISSEGDITLTNLGASAVAAENVMGDIFFDGELAAGGNYRFSTVSGTISLRIPFSSNFKLIATAPSTRNIVLGAFVNPNMSFLGDGRRVVGKWGDGSATITVTDQRGAIQFFRR
ncbi:MAG: hypothetical protein JO053_00565 [Acidobacteria bacterium]|nr:hypothetical protein [Acidobacteriota bacterium]